MLILQLRQAVTFCTAALTSATATLLSGRGLQSRVWRGWVCSTATAQQPGPPLLHSASYAAAEMLGSRQPGV